MPRSRSPLVAVLVFPKISVFETAVASEVFGLDRTDMGVPKYELVLCCEGAPVSLPTKDGGFHAQIEHNLAVLRRADIVVCPGWTQGFDNDVPQSALDELRRAHKRGAWLVSFCSGAHVLASTGLLDGRRAATHWMHAVPLHDRHPEVVFDNEVLYVDDDSGIYTSAGTAAAIDLSLHIMRKRHGAEAANTIARRMVMPAHRTGGQAQFIDHRISVPGTPNTVTDSMIWARKHLANELSVPVLAKRANMSTRTYARRFRDEAGTTPLQWILQQRILEAQRMLESTSMSVERVASAVGLGSASNLRIHFARGVGVSPLLYRQTFHTNAS